MPGSEKQTVAMQAGIENMSNAEEKLIPSALSTQLGARASAAMALARRQASRHAWCSDNSTFSALNLDVRRSPSSSPFATVESPLLTRVLLPSKEKQSKTGNSFMAMPRQMSSQSGVFSEEGNFSRQSTCCSKTVVDPRPIQHRATEEIDDTRFVEARRELLGFRACLNEDVPYEIVSLVASRHGGVRLPRNICRGHVDELAKEGTTTTPASTRTPKEVGTPTATGGTRTPGSSTGILTPSEKAFKPRARDMPEDFKRTVQSLLNKICPENLAAIVERLASLEIREAEQLGIVIELIFKKALAEPHYCETYADLVFSMNAVFPEFPSSDGGRPITFRSALLDICQSEFEALREGAQDGDGKGEAALDRDELEFRRMKRNERMRANMKFVGHLFLRQLLSVKVVGSVLRELLHMNEVDELPGDHSVECACELLMSVGYTLEEMPMGNAALQQVCGRLLELKIMKTSAGKGAFCKRIQFMVQDLLDTRAAGWAKKSFKSSAKTKDEIRQEQERELAAKMCGKELSSAEHTVVGQRPTYLSPSLGA